MSASAIITAVLSLFTPQSTNDGINVTVNTTNNVGHTLEQKEKPLLSAPPADIIRQRTQLSKAPIIIASVGATYIVTYFYLSRLAYKLNNYSCWSKWRKDFSVENLRQHKNNTCLADFIKSAKKHYHYNPETKDFFEIIIKLRNDLETEKKSLKHYLQYANFIKQIKLETIFPIDAKLIQEIPSRIERLNALNKLIWSFNNTYMFWGDD